MTSNRRLSLLLLLMVVAPLAVLTVVGRSWVASQATLYTHDLQEIQRDRLADVASSVQRFMGERERALGEVAVSVAGVAGLDGAPDRIREVLEATPTVRHALVLDPDGRVRFPPPDGPTSEAERELLRRTAVVWRGGALETLAAEALSNEGGPGVRQGWHGWYYDGGLNLLRWVATEAHLVAVELPREVLLADLIGELPVTEVGPADDTPTLTRLVDAGGHVVYQWGLYEPVDAAVVAEHALADPLGAWSLQLFAPPSDAPVALSRSLALQGGLGGLGLALALVGLALWLWRDRTREMRLASQRVSFVNQVSHELKTPLTNIRLYAELLEDEVDGLYPEDEGVDPRAARYLDVIVSESRRLSRLIHNVLTFARGREGRLVVRPVTGDVDQAIDETLESFRPALKAKGIAVSRRANAGGPALVDRDAVGQIVANLLSNVEKYAAGGGEVTVASRREGDVVHVEVSDRGPGVPAQARERIFEPFVRLGDRLSDGAAGTGIGLGIARTLARLHGGDLTLGPSDGGACLVLTIRAPRAPAVDGAEDEAGGTARRWCWQRTTRPSARGCGRCWRPKATRSWRRPTVERRWRSSRPRPPTLRCSTS